MPERSTGELPPAPRSLLSQTAAGVAICALSAGSVVALYAQHRWTADLHGVASALLPPAAHALWWRRRYPWQVLGAMLALGLAAGSLAGPMLLWALYTVTTIVPRRQALAAAVATVVAFACSPLLGGIRPAVPRVASILTVVAAVTAFGLYNKVRLDYIAALRDRARQLDREQRLLAERAVTQERERIARDLHDVVAHHLSIIVVQAGAVEELAGNGPLERELAASIARSGREALADMRALLGVLRPDGASPELSPQPGIADLGALVELTEASGVPVRFDIQGTPRPLPPGFDLSVYRIAQESLTNVRKHAGPASVRMVLAYRADAVELRVTDDGRGGHAASNGGHGLVGMRERVAMFGGDFSAGPSQGHGFEVRALLPTGADRR